MELNSFIENIVAGLGYELVEIKLSHNKLLQVFIDCLKQDESITLEDCALVSQQLNYSLTAEDVDYNRLEVSSPGCERALNRIENFVKFTDKIAKVQYLESGAQQAIVGVIKEVDMQNNIITMEVQQDLKSAVDYKINYLDIIKARLVLVQKNSYKNINNKRSRSS